MEARRTVTSSSMATSRFTSSSSRHLWCRAKTRCISLRALLTAAMGVWPNSPAPSLTRRPRRRLPLQLVWRQVQHRRLPLLPRQRRRLHRPRPRLQQLHLLRQRDLHRRRDSCRRRGRVLPRHRARSFILQPRTLTASDVELFQECCSHRPVVGHLSDPFTLKDGPQDHGHSIKLHLRGSVEFHLAMITLARD